MHRRGRSTLPRRGLAGVVATLAVTLAVAALPGQAPVADASAAVTPRSAPSTTFRVATFNVLGNSHTAPGGNRKGWASGKTRMGWATQLINKFGFGLVGFQEFEPIQYATFHQLMPGWGLAPQDGRSAEAANSIAWRSSDWTAIVRSSYRAPYFHGQMQDRPLVQLRNNHTGQLVWVLNTHNPADTRGNAQKWRDQAERIQAALVNKLRRQQPEVPVIFVGDMNDASGSTSGFYCPMVYLTELESASGGTHGTPPDPTCQIAPRPVYDWIMGTPPIQFSGYTSYKDALVKKTTDHTLVFSDATIPPAPSAVAGVKRVVVIDVEGLRPSLVNARRTPWISWLRDRGASTLRARTTAETTTALSNTVSLVTGRKVSRTKGGHGASQRSVNGYVHRTAGQYVSSIFDVAHNLNLTTGLYSGDSRARFLVRSWSSQHGGADSWGRNNGRRKLSVARVGDNDAAAGSAARAQLARKALPLTFLQLAQPLRAGQRHGFASAAYYRDLHATDARIGRLLRTITRDPDTAGSTMVVLTSSTTGLARGHRYAVPLIAWGPGIQHADLYALNPQYRDPGSSRTTYAGPQPIRNADVANLVMDALRLPSVPRSYFNAKQRLNVFAPSIIRLSASRNSSGR